MEMPIILIRGVPGSGKSTFAKLIQQKLSEKYAVSAAIFETDSFFMDQVDGAYHFDKTQLQLAHSWNQGEVYRFCRDCVNCPAIVANTFIQTWELKPYLEIAKHFNRPVRIFTLCTAHENVHGVPDETVKRMRVGLQNLPMDKWLSDYGAVESPWIYLDSQKEYAIDAYLAMNYDESKLYG